MPEACGEPHPNFTGVVCILPSGPHASHIPDGYLRWDASSPQPWNNTNFVMPAQVSSAADTKAATLGVAQRLEPEFARAHKNDPQTSHDAAQSLGDLRDNMAHVLNVIATYGPVTQDTVHGICCEDNGEDWDSKAHSSYRSLVSSLQKRGLVRDSGLRGMSDRGNPAVQYEVTEEGMALLRGYDRLPV